MCQCVQQEVKNENTYIKQIKVYNKTSCKLTHADHTRRIGWSYHQTMKQL